MCSLQINSLKIFIIECINTVIKGSIYMYRHTFYHDWKILGYLHHHYER